MTPFLATNYSGFLQTIFLDLSWPVAALLAVVPAVLVCIDKTRKIGLIFCITLLVLEAVQAFAFFSMSAYEQMELSAGMRHLVLMIFAQTPDSTAPTHTVLDGSLPLIFTPAALTLLALVICLINLRSKRAKVTGQDAVGQPLRRRPPPWLQLLTALLLLNLAFAATQFGAGPLDCAGQLYHEWCARNDMLYRFIASEYIGQDWNNDLLHRTDVYLFEWNLTQPLGATPLTAKRARRVDTYFKNSWKTHWALDADHYLTSDGWSTEVLEYRGDTLPAQVTAHVEGITPVPCNSFGQLSVNHSGTVFAGAKSGLFLFDARTLAPMRELKRTAALTKFLAARPDETDATNSACFLTDDTKCLVRIAATYIVQQRGANIDGTIAVVYNLDNDSVRDIPIKVGLRADIKDVERIDGVLWFYLSTTSEKMKWTQQLRDETGQKVFPLSPEQQPDMTVMGWDYPHSRFVEIPGYDVTTPQPMDVNSTILIQQVPSGAISRGVIRYGDAQGQPAIFYPGTIKFNSYQ